MSLSKQALCLADPRRDRAPSTGYTSCFPAGGDAVLHKTLRVSVRHWRELFFAACPVPGMRLLWWGTRHRPSKQCSEHVILSAAVFEIGLSWNLPAL